MRERLARDLQAVLERHRKFWDLEDVDRPLLMVPVDVYVPTEQFCATIVQERLLDPNDIDMALLLEEYDRMASVHERLGDDYLVVAEPVLGIPWLEAMVGCPIHVSSTGAMAAKSVKEAENIETIAVPPEDRWFRKSLDCLRVAASHASGRYSVGIGHLRGPTDILFALMGPQSFFLAFYDHREKIQRLAELAARAWTDVAKAQLAVIPPFKGGYVLRWFGIWAPGITAWLQDDASTMISREFYRDLFLPWTKKAMIFPYSVMHLHSPSLHIVDLLLDTDLANLRAININLDPTGPSLDKAIPVLRRIQQHQKALILSKDIYENFTLEEYDEIMSALSPRGLCVWLDGRSVEEAQRILALAKERSSVGRRRIH